MAKKQSPSLISQYKQSFRDFWQPKTIILIFFDLLFLALFYGALLGYGGAVTNLASGLEGAGLDFLFEQDTITADTMAQVEAQSKTMQSFLINFWIVSILFVLLLIACWAFTRGIIWTKLLNKKFTAAFFKAFFPMQVIWSIIVIALFMLTLRVVKASLPYQSFTFHPMALLITLGVFLLVILYFTAILHYVGTQQPHYWHPIQDALKIGFRGKIIPAYVLALATFIVLAYLVSYALAPLEPRTAAYIELGILLLFSAWMRYFLVRVFQHRLG